MLFKGGRSRREFEKEIVAVEAQGFATNHSERVEGISCVAAAILDVRDRPIGAVWVTGPSFRISKQDIVAIAAAGRLEHLLRCHRYHGVFAPNHRVRQCTRRGRLLPPKVKSPARTTLHGLPGPRARRPMTIEEKVPATWLAPFHVLTSDTSGVGRLYEVTLR